MIPIGSFSHTVMRRILMVALVVTIPLVCVAQPTPPGAQVLVTLVPEAGQAQLDRMLANLGYTLLHDYKTPGLYLLGLPENVSVADGLARLQAQSVVKSVSPDQPVYLTGIPNDTLWPGQWHWTKIGMPAAWDVQTGSPETVVAVVDGGVDVAHQDLVGRIWTNPGEIAANGIDDDNNGYIDDVNGFDFANGTGNPTPDDDPHAYYAAHGTQVAGIIGATGNNALGVAGANWQCKLMPVQIHSGTTIASSIAIMGLEYAVANGADLVNLSFSGAYIPEWTPPIEWAHKQGVVLVAAATGHFTDSSETWRSPVCNDGPMLTDNHVIGVAAVGEDDKPYLFGSGADRSHRSFVDLVAPGDSIRTTDYPWSGLLPPDPAGGGFYHSSYSTLSGASASAAIVTGLASLIMADTPGATPSAVRQRLVNSCVDINSLNPLFVGMLGAGRVSASACFVDNPPGAPRSVQAQDTTGDSGGSITITWQLSLDDGRGGNDITRYKVFRGESAEGEFTEVADLVPGTREFIDTTVDDGMDYYYQVVAYDARMSASSPVTSPAQSRDDLAPPAVQFSAEDQQGDEGGAITVRWSAYPAPVDFREFRIYRSEDPFSTVQGMTPLARISDRTETSYRDSDIGDDHDYYYAVTAVDTEAVPNELTQVEAAGPVRANPNYTFNFPAHLSMISLGLNMQGMDLSQFLGGTETILYRYNPAKNQYVAYPGVDSDDEELLRHVAGKGYWLRTNVPLSLNLSGSAATTEVPIEFTAGWNQLGNPYVDDVNIAGARVEILGTSLTLQQSNDEGLTSGYVWIYDNATAAYKLVSESLPFSQQTIRRGDGFFFYATRSGRLILPNPRAVAPAAARPTAVPSSNVNWVMRLAVSSNGAADTDNFLGVSPEPASLNGIASPPAAVGGLDLSFVGEKGPSATQFVRSLGEKQEWQAQVRCTQAGARVKVGWPDLSQLPRDCRPILRDKASGKAVYMRTTSSYSFSMAPNVTTRDFTIEISSKVGDLLAISSLQTGAAADGAQISYTLSAPAEVDVQVINMAGRPVRRLGSVAGQSGLNTALWNGRNDNGLRVPSGVYLVKVSARTDDGQIVNAVQGLSLRR